MKKIIILLCCMPIFSFAQQNSKVVTNSEPTYPKGDNELYTYMYYNLKFTEEAKQKNIEGEVTVSFDVKTDSTTTNILIISGVGYGVDQEIKNIITKLKFSPGVQNGMPIKMGTMYSFPVKAH
ncbi:MAG: energy transducer TonB [Bacteroidetes bacterium]|jgi:TonB family protein|nr:energy transducer TonB [Bacteroidota bacterium]